MSAIDILREKGLKKSAQRISIINILLDKQIPLTESDIKAEMEICMTGLHFTEQYKHCWKRV
mgnify:CR=1 FL=1